MYKEIEVNENLFYLEHVLFSLDSFKFDDDVIKVLDYLKTLVDKKLYSNFPFEDYNVLDEKIKIRFLLQK